MREKIDSATWKRRAHCALFGRLDVPFYSVTFRLDVTNLYAWCKREGLPFYHSLMWVTMRAVNRTDAYLYELEGAVMDSRDDTLIEDWRRLQTSDHVYYMSTKFSHDGNVHDYFSPYGSPYDAFMYFMNAVRDMRWRILEHHKGTL